MALKLKKLVQGLVAAGALVASAAHASLIPASPATYNGTGLGNVSTVLTINSPANTTTATGSVMYTAGGDVVAGNTQAINQTRTLGELGLTAAEQLRIVFNPQEPQNDADGIILTNLMLTIYSSTGVALFNSGAFTPQTYTSGTLGTGQSGFVFMLDAAQALAANTAAFAGNFANNRIGLSATVNNATGGFETFFVARAPGNGNPGGGGNQVPEPASLALLSLGMLGFAAARRRSAKKH